MRHCRRYGSTPVHAVIKIDGGAVEEGWSEGGGRGEISDSSFITETQSSWRIIALAYLQPLDT